MYRKGYNFERKVKLELESEGWKVIRSGGSKKPDMVAAREGKIIIIECKATKNSKVYLETDEVEKMQETASHFNGECMYAIKKNNCKWMLVSVESLRKTENFYVFDIGQ